MITKYVKLYLGDGFPVRIPVSQFDTMWQFVFEIIHNSQPWQIPTGATAVLNGKKPDGNVFAFSGTIENNTVTVDADVQMTAVAGQTVCELSILADGKTVGTANFILDVEEAPKSADDVVSDTVLDGYGMMVTNAVDSWLNSHSGQIGGLTNEAKQALLALLEKVAYVDENGQTYLDALETALYPPADLLSISAVFNQGDNAIYDTDSLDTLKQYLTVTANMSDGTTQAVSNYTLSGTLAEGTSTITASYGGKASTFDVTVTAAPIDTTAIIEQQNKVLLNPSNTPNTQSKTNAGITIKYQMDDQSTVLYPAGIIPVYSLSEFGTAPSLVIYDENGEAVSYVNEHSTSKKRWVQSVSGTMTEFSQSWPVSGGKYYTQIAFSLDTRYLDDAYMYDKTTGKVWFAGKNTPYYGMSNISEAQ